LDIPQSIIEEYLVPKDYCKPKIEIRNYYLKWNVESCGILQKETNELKKFLTNAIPFFDTSYELLNNFEKAKYKDKYRLHKELSPALNISYINKHTGHHIVGYELYMNPDGSTFIDRIESVRLLRTTTTEENDNDIAAKKADMQRKQVKPIFYLKWTLGELLFNRQGKLANPDRV
jgi:hypothetical protein